jgi:hypothetical protein
MIARAMTQSNENAPETPTTATPARALSPAALRALEEAAGRRADYVASEARLPKEIGGRKGLEPGRYGDWEVKGLTSDF